MMLALLLAVATMVGRPPERLQVTTQRGVQRITLRLDARYGSMVPLAPLVDAVGGTIESADPWVVWRSPSGRFRFLGGTPLVDDGNQVRSLPAPVMAHADTVWVPLSFVAEVLADPARKAWTWTASSATIAEGPPISPLVSRPAATTVGAEERARLPSGLRPGHHVTIDAGHGGTDPGNPGMFFPNGLKEKDVTLAVSLLVRDELERRGVKVTMTRTTDTLIALGQRAPRFCRDACDLFVSIHVNSLPKRAGYTTVRGFETYFQAEARTADAARVAAMENEALRYEVADSESQVRGLDFILKDLQANEFLREAARAAELVQSSLGEVHGGGDRGVKQANFAVLNTARRPAILVEIGYSTNRDDARQMTTSSGQRELAGAIARAIVSYLREFDRKTGATPAGAP